MPIEKVIQSLNLEQNSIFNRVMKSSFYYPIAASTIEPQTNYPTDVINPASNTIFYTEYFVALNVMPAEVNYSSKYISFGSLSEFVNAVVAIVRNLSVTEKKFLLAESEAFAKMERNHFEETGVTLEEHHSIFQTTKMVSQLLRYRAAYGEMGYFRTAA